MGEAPATQVLAVASHVAYGYVGNTMATFVMQVLGCEVTAINTVNFSNHTGYRQVKGRKTTAEEVADLYEGLRQSNLDNFDMMLSGYCPSAAVVREVGKIARDARLKSAVKPGSFFWILDPVMGDDGRLYVAEDVVPAYKNLLRDADLILPNQFEAELMSDVKITDFNSLAKAIGTLHTVRRVPHVIITSVRLPPTAASTPVKGRSRTSSPSRTSTSALSHVPKLSIVGSTARADMSARLFRITVPALPVFFSGTGDMFAALMIARLREAAAEADLLGTKSWQSPDDVPATELPLAQAAEKVLASMHAVLSRTAKAREEEVKLMDSEASEGVSQSPERKDGRVGEQVDKIRHLRLTRAAEVRVVSNVKALIDPPDQDALRAQPVEVEVDLGNSTEADEHGVVKAAPDGQGAQHIVPPSA